MKKLFTGVLVLALLLVPATALAAGNRTLREAQPAFTEESATAMNDLLQKERNAAVMYEKMTDAFGEDTPYAQLAQRKNHRVQMMESRMEEYGIAITASEGQANVPADEIAAVQDALALEKEIAYDFADACRDRCEQGKRDGFRWQTRHSSRNIRFLEALSESLERGESSSDYENLFAMHGNGFRGGKGCRGGW